MTPRDDDALRESRRRLFDRFPHSAPAGPLLDYQRVLVEEILSCEAERKADPSPTLREHVHRVRLYADALAFDHLSTYALRQLARGSGKPPSIAGQGTAFDLTLRSAQLLADAGIPALIADLTNVLKHGDVIGCLDPDAPLIVECKQGGVRHPHFERQGRRGRQLSRIESVDRFLRTGSGKFFGDPRERGTIEITGRLVYRHSMIDEFVQDALNGRPTTKLVNEFELYAVASSDLPQVMSDQLAAVQLWQNLDPGTLRVAVGGLQEPLEGAWADIPPPVLWDMSEAARWNLMEGTVSVVHMLRPEAFLGRARGALRIDRIIDGPGSFPWLYEIDTTDGPITIGPICLWQVLYAHATIESAADELLEMAEKAHGRMRNEQPN